MCHEFSHFFDLLLQGFLSQLINPRPKMASAKHRVLLSRSRFYKLCHGEIEMPTRDRDIMFDKPERLSSFAAVRCAKEKPFCIPR